MTQQGIIEGNRLIAEFMGKTYKEDSGERGYLFPINGAFDRRIMPSEMQYHSSWDWLMPVVEKINKLFSEKSRELSNRSREQEGLPDPLDNPLCWKSWSSKWIHLSTDINYVYKKAVGAITWYNTQKQQP